jgi:hypothetical protein
MLNKKEGRCPASLMWRLFKVIGVGIIIKIETEIQILL